MLWKWICAIGQYFKKICLAVIKFYVWVHILQFLWLFVIAKKIYFYENLQLLQKDFYDFE